jgi:hypothetical protein
VFNGKILGHGETEVLIIPRVTTETAERIVNEDLTLQDIMDQRLWAGTIQPSDLRNEDGTPVTSAQCELIGNVPSDQTFLYTPEIAFYMANV